MKTTVCRLLTGLGILIAVPLAAHPGDGLIVEDQTFYFVATDPIAPTSSHHAALWRWSEESGLLLTYRSPHGSSNLHIEQGLDGLIYCAERRYLGDRPARPGDQPGDRDVYETKLGRIGPDGKIIWLMGPERGRSPFGRAAFLVDRDSNIVFAEARNRVMIRDVQGRTKPLEVEETFDNIQLLAWGPEGDIYVLDGWIIKVIAPDGSVRTLNLRHRSAETEFVRGHGTDGTIIFDLIVDQERHIFLADWGRQIVLRINSEGVVSLMHDNSGDFGPEGLAFYEGSLAVFESLRPRANRGILPRLTSLGLDGDASLIYEYSGRG